MNHRPAAQLAHYLHIFACVYGVHNPAHIVGVNSFFSLVGRCAQIMQYNGENAKLFKCLCDEMSSWCLALWPSCKLEAGAADNESFFPSKGDLIKSGVMWGFFHITHQLCCHRIDGCGSFWQMHGWYLWQKEHTCRNLCCSFIVCPLLKWSLLWIFQIRNKVN